MCGIVLSDQSYLDVLEYQLIPWHVRMLKHMAYAFIRVYLQNAYTWYCSPVYPIHITYHIRLCDYIHDRCKSTFICTWSHADLRMIAHVRPLLDAFSSHCIEEWQRFVRRHFEFELSRAEATTLKVREAFSTLERNERSGDDVMHLVWKWWDVCGWFRVLEKFKISL